MVRPAGAVAASCALPVDDANAVWQMVYFHLLPGNGHGIRLDIGALGMAPNEGAWFRLCHRLTPQVERLSARSALLDLGTCSATEAMTAIGALMRAVEDLGYATRVGIAPGLTLAQLAAFTAPRDQPLRLLTAMETPAFLRTIPVAILPRLHPRGTVTPAIVARLERFGLRTLGQLARLDATALRRQFGDAGPFLAAVAQGRDPQPLRPTPLPPTLCLRVRGLDAMPSERVLALAPRLASHLARALHEHGRRARLLHAQLRGDSGSIRRATITLRQHTDESALLARELQRLLVTLLLPSGERPAEGLLDGIDEIRLTLGDFASDQPNQGTFWHTRDQRLATLQIVADGLDRRHGRPLLLRAAMIHPAAIFDEERQRLVAIGEADGTHGTRKTDRG